MNASSDRHFIFAFRMLMAWTFLYAASQQIFDPKFSIVGFLSHTKTFHDLFILFTAPSIAPVVSFLVGYGHLLIGLSLLLGLMVRVSATFGVGLLMMYWLAHMDFSYIENSNNLIVDYHIVYSTVLVYLIVKQAGHVWGLDAWLKNLPVVLRHPNLRPLFA